jgi:hypothetical protein
MRDDEPTPELFLSELPERDPIVCELANGHTVKIVAALWSRWRTYEEWSAGVRPEPYFAIRIYCTETTLPKRLAWIEEYTEEADFPVSNFDEIWQWLTELCASREVFDFDDFREFMDHVSDGIIRFSTPEPDAVEHIEHLAELTDPEAFDKVDDSVFNDQNDADTER